MKIIKTFDWLRRNFSFEAKCENCNHTEIHRGGCDDDNYYRNVVPNMKCGKCKKSSVDLNTNISTIITKYDPNIVM